MLNRTQLGSSQDLDELVNARFTSEVKDQKELASSTPVYSQGGLQADAVTLSTEVLVLINPRRQAKIEALRASIIAGTYNVSSTSIAEAMLLRSLGL